MCLFFLWSDRFWEELDIITNKEELHTGLFKGRGKCLPTRWGKGKWLMEPWAPVCQQQAEKIWGEDTLETLGQERAKCLYFPFWINVPDSCWLSRHNSVAAGADPLNVTFLATQRPCCRAWESLCSIRDVAVDFCGGLWQIAYLAHLQGGGNHPTLTPALAHLYQSVPCGQYLLLCVLCTERISLAGFSKLACNDSEQW